MINAEFWIDDDGNEIFCDGDSAVDVPNHSMVIVNHCAHLLIDALMNEGSDFSYQVASIIEEIVTEDVIDCVMLRCAISDSIDEWVQMGLLTEDQACNVYEHIRNITGIDDEIVTIAVGQHDDPRVYGTKIGWIRVIGNNFNVHKLTCGVAERIQDFVSEHGKRGSKWNIEIEDFRGQRRYLFGLKESELEYRNLLRELTQTISV